MCPDFEISQNDFFQYWNYVSQLLEIIFLFEKYSTAIYDIADIGKLSYW